MLALQLIGQQRTAENIQTNRRGQAAADAAQKRTSIENMFRRAAMREKSLCHGSISTERGKG